MTSRSSSRHLRPDSTGRTLAPVVPSRVVLVGGEPAYLAAPAGQHLAQTTVNLLARQYGVLEQIILDFPDIPVHRGVFPGDNPTGSFATALYHWASAIAGPEVMIKAGGHHRPPECTVAIGADPRINGEGFRISATAEGRLSLHYGRSPHGHHRSRRQGNANKPAHILASKRFLGPETPGPRISS